MDHPLFPKDPKEQLSDEEDEEEVEDEKETVEDGVGLEVVEETEDVGMVEDWGWAHLPDVCLRQAFRWLKDRDRVRAALVCRHWHHVMHSPSLWRCRTFTFFGHMFRMRRPEQETAVCYARTYGRYLEDLEVSFWQSFNSLVARRFQKTMRAFLTSLRKAGARLRCLTISHLELDRSVWCRSIRNALVCSLTFFLRREGFHLNYLSLRMARLDLFQGLEVLEAVAATQQHLHLVHKPGITSLNLEDFFSQVVNVYSCPTFPQVISRFKGLTSLTLNYSCVSAELLAALAANCRSGSGGSSLRSLTLHCHIHEPHEQVIGGESWAYLVQQCPHLSVYMTVERILGVERLSCILRKQIPLRAISLTSYYFSQQDWSAKPALTLLLPHYSHCLQRLTLDLNNRHESLDEELLELVLACSKLSFLNVWAFLQVSFLDHLLQKCLAKESGLRTIKVHIYTNKCDTQEEDDQLGEVYYRYRQLINTELYYFAVNCPVL